MSEDKQNQGEKKSKLIVDSDWKEQAEKEKEELAGNFELPDGQGMPKPDFIHHCASLATQAMILLGAIANPMTGQAEYDPEQARYLIDTLGMLREKTQGNLTPEETNTIDNLVGELKVAWVQITSEHKKA
jgi:hypothetical protein